MDVQDRQTLLELQEHKGYGEDEGEREAALAALADGEQHGASRATESTGYTSSLP